MKWLIVFKRENQDEAMAVLKTLQCTILKPCVGLDEKDCVVSVDGPDNLMQLVDDLTKLVEPLKNIIEVWCDSKMSSAKKTIVLGDEMVSFDNQKLTDDVQLDILNSPTKKGV